MAKRSNGPPKGGDAQTFTGASLWKIMSEKKVLKKGQKRPSNEDLGKLARSLNNFRGGGFLMFAEAMPASLREAEEAKASSDVERAIRVLVSFFKERARAWHVEGVSPEVIEAERRLYGQFHEFIQAMLHRFDELFGGGAGQFKGMPPVEAWHEIAEPVAGAFNTAMTSANGEKGLKSAAARFVAAVVPAMTGEKTTAGAVKKFFNDQKRRRQ